MPKPYETLLADLDITADQVPEYFSGPLAPPGDKKYAAVEKYLSAVKALLVENGLTLAPMLFIYGAEAVMKQYVDSPLLPQLQKVAEAL